MTDIRSPQLEDGHIRIANELFDAVLRAKLKYSTQTVLLAVMRKTYGYGKKEDDASASQLGEICGMSRQHVTTALNELYEMNVIRKRPGRYGTIVGVNKDYSKWKLGSPNLGQVSKARTSKPAQNDSPNLGQVNDSRTGVQITDSDSPNLGQVDSPNLGHTKDNLPKDNKQKIPPNPQGGIADTKPKKKTTEPSDDFLKAWSLYPRRKGTNPQHDALRSWNARIREGESASAMIRGVKAYAKQVRSEGKEHTEFVMQGQRFFGRSKIYLEVVGDSDGGEDWWFAGGFETEFDAVNAGANQYNIHKFEVTA